MLINFIPFFCEHLLFFIRCAALYLTYRIFVLHAEKFFLFIFSTFHRKVFLQSRDNVHRNNFLLLFDFSLFHTYFFVAASNATSFMSIEFYIFHKNPNTKMEDNDRASRHLIFIFVDVKNSSFFFRNIRTSAIHSLLEKHTRAALKVLSFSLPLQNISLRHVLQFCNMFLQFSVVHSK